MANKKQSAPPRPIAAGDVVAAFSAELGEWTAAQIVRIDAANETAAVLELDWSGPEPVSVGELGDVSPLRLTHHSWNGSLSYCNFEWVLPRSHKVIGNLPPLHDEPSNGYGYGWRLGDQLVRQRRWDAGLEDDPPMPWKLACTGAEVDEMGGVRPDVTRLHVRDIVSLDCGRLVGLFPNLTELDLRGDLGLLAEAGRLNDLTSLKSLSVFDLFGMTKEDRLQPRCTPDLEELYLYGIPAEYANAMRSTWRPEIPNGTRIDIRGARKPEWVAENRDNPLRDWDGRGQISKTNFKKSVAQYKATRRAVMAVLAEVAPDDRPARLTEIGREYGEAFNEFDRRAGFIETVEREELFEALHRIATDAGAEHGLEPDGTFDSLASGVESVRDW
ncbi:hypothetical protein BJF79_26025 [Actinomadura sp. CNU-125]|uniref:hypothetical protein n=1 Tax=Actinomadura sp. CNU-125 TaxID=1904961 RepID=UPI0009677AE8|nr:hypothetical protein [Actinomadura sp. CNU-125]OLT10487.1 hypothetical protein BJF79_26025 [Actinomadura sp. CNU-125]